MEGLTLKHKNREGLSVDEYCRLVDNERIVIMGCAMDVFGRFEDKYAPKGPGKFEIPDNIDCTFGL